jgi:hypothetical protein
MRSFVDSQGDTWDINITVWEVREVKRECDVYLTALADDNYALLRRLYSEMGLFGDVLSVVLTEQIEERGLDAKQFARRISADVVMAAYEALTRAIADFFFSPAARKALHIFIDKALATAKAMETTAMEHVTELEKMDANSLARKCIDFASSGQASPELFHTPLPMGS